MSIYLKQRVMFVLLRCLLNWSLPFTSKIRIYVHLPVYTYLFSTKKYIQYLYMLYAFVCHLQLPSLRHNSFFCCPPLFRGPSTKRRSFSKNKTRKTWIHGAQKIDINQAEIPVFSHGVSAGFFKVYAYGGSAVARGEKNALRSHDSEKRLIKKCRELNQEIVSNATKAPWRKGVVGKTRSVEICVYRIGRCKHISYTVHICLCTCTYPLQGKQSQMFTGIPY